MVETEQTPFLATHLQFTALVDMVEMVAAEQAEVETLTTVEAARVGRLLLPERREQVEREARHPKEHPDA